MSRIGKKPVVFPQNVKISESAGIIKVEGPKGILSSKIPEGITMVVNEGNLVVERKSDERTARSYHGLVRTLIGNMVTGVSTGFTKNLEISGVGYRAEVKDKALLLSLGFSHQVSFDIPDGISIEVDKLTKLLVKGFDKELVGQTAAKIRSFRPPEPYKGKGIKYADETIMRKAGKTGKK